ncbi:MAG: cell surface protein, partial [Verrucomicrobiae bacterium]|nr:cell surface protein [Verrucomicrobiae bacterium]
MKLLARIVTFLLVAVPSLRAGASDFLSPTALAITRDGTVMFVACGTVNRVLRLDPARKEVLDYITLPASPSGLVLSADDKMLYVTCAAPESEVDIIDVAQMKIVGAVPVGHTALSPVLSPDGRRLYVCNQFDNDVSVIDLGARREMGRIPVLREPVSADITRDGKYLLVANHLSNRRADSEDVDAAVSVIDLAAGRTVKEMELPDGSTGLQRLRVSPDGKYAVLTHIFSNFDQPTRRVDRGQINANALTIISVGKLEPQCTFYLDSLEQGAGNPWAVAWSADGTDLVVTHAGTHEVSLIDFPALLAGLPRNAKEKIHTDASTPVLKFAPHFEDDQENDGLPFLVGARQRIKLPEGDLGPRAAIVNGHTLYTANYFSDTLSVIDLMAPDSPAVSIPLGPKTVPSAVRQGEFYFHDANLCRQGWQSCATCHPGGGRADGLDWQVGRNHPKNTKSLLLAEQTMPVDLTTNGVSELATNLDDAVRLQIKTLFFTNLSEDIVRDLEQYIRSLKPVPSPYLSHGRLAESAKRGEAIFAQVGCNTCHPPGLFTDLRWHDVGTRVRFDKSARFPTPSLLEVWRTAPYLH